MNVATQAYAVRWRDANRWDIKAARATQFRLAHPHFRPLAHFAEEATVTVNPAAKPDHEWPVYGVNNSTGVFLSHRQRGADFNSAYKRIEKDWFFHNPTRANVGSLGRVPTVPDDAITSPEYQVWRLTGQLIPAFVEILIRTRYFLELIDCHRVGAVKERLFVSNLLEIPVPDLAEPQQRAIVTAFEKSKAKAAALRIKADELDAVAEADFLKALGLTPPADVTPPKSFALHWRQLARWSVSFGQRAGLGANLDHSRYPLATLGEHLVLLQYGTSEKANALGKGVAVLRINNIKAGRIDTSDLKHVPLPAKAAASLRLANGDVVVIRTSGSRDLVGTCAVFELNEEFVFASYLIRMRFATAILDPRYAAYFINGALGRLQVDTLSRQIMQNNINSDELRSIRIPLPPRKVQEQLMARVESARGKAEGLRIDAVSAEQEAHDEAESLIMGSKPAHAASGTSPA
ncbi:MAG TPA: restriction endonuclease subunit S [Phycisphaerales bacterium]|nr:restriction endonuclease subunit S [Phycisphaerales bacterium]